MPTKLEIRRIDLWSIFKLAFMVYAVIGLIVGVFYGFFLLLANALTSFSDEIPEFRFLKTGEGIRPAPLRKD